jgi:hypothetical protein
MPHLAASIDARPADAGLRNMPIRINGSAMHNAAAPCRLYRPQLWLRNTDMNDRPLDHQSLKNTLDQLSQTVDIMGSVISRLQQHLESLMQQRAELIDDAQVPPLHASQRLH